MTSKAGETDVLEAVSALASLITTRAEEIERGRRLPPDLVADLTAAGCFRSLVPRSHGGSELSLPAHLHMIEQLSSADGSVGWTVAIGSAAPVLLSKLPRATFDALYAPGPDVVIAGTFNPTGVATVVEGGFRVTGQWSFASGCQHTTWLLAHAVVDDGRQPPVRMMLLPPSDAEIKDTWSVSGLCGTGSHDFVVNDVFVPVERTFAVWDQPCIDAPMPRVPELSFSALVFSAVALGIAGAALGDITGMAGGKVPAFSDGALAANPWFQHQLGETDALLRAGRALLATEAATAWEAAAADVAFTPQHRARIRSTATWVVGAAATVVDTAYTAGGGTSLFTSSPLQRRLRDIHALTQHFAVKPDTFTKAGAVLAGQDVDLTFL